MFFQSPRPFGQHSTSYRSMNSSMHSSSSMTSLQMLEPKNGRASAPPISFTSFYESNRFGPSGPPTDHASISTINFEQTRTVKESGLAEAIKNMERNRSDIINSAEASTFGSKNYEKHKTASLYDPTDSGTSVQNLNIFQSEVRIPISKSGVFQVQRRNVNQQLPPCVRQAQSQKSQPEQTLQNVGLYHKEYQRPIAGNQGSRFRSSSTMPFTEHVPKPVVIQSQPVPIFTTGGYATTQPTHEHGSFSEARVRSSAQFNASQVPFNEQQQQKPIAYQQLERRKNYATLHHIAPPKIGPLQRRTSDPYLMKINGNDSPENIVMFNVAKGVRAELEQDPKFRRKADSLASRTAEPVTGTFSPPPVKEQPKQSPSLRQMGNFFEQNVQQFHDMLSTKRPPPVPSAEPFNVEHVRNIFRTNNTVRPESLVMANSTSMDTQAKQDNLLLEKPIKSLVETYDAQDGMSHNKLKEDMRTSGIISQQTISTFTESADSARKLIEQKTCSVSETSNKNIQGKPPTTFIVDKPVTTIGTDKSHEMQKKITVIQEKPIVSEDIALLEKNYNSLATFAAPSRLNQPFPIDDATFISSSGKTRNATGLSGILMKDGNSIRSVNDSGIKTPKKVAFQCDKDSTYSTRNELAGSKSK